MTRDELLATFEAALAAEGSFLLPPPPVTGQPPAPDGKTRIVEAFQSFDGSRYGERHFAYWWDQPMTAKANQDFYVIDPGTPQETACWLKNRDPKAEAPDPSFQQQVLEWLRGKTGQVVGPYTIKHVASATADQETQTGTARVLVEQAGALCWLDVFLNRDGGGSIQFEVIPTG